MSPVSPLRIRCSSCATPRAAIAVEYGHPDADLSGRADRGEVAIGGDVRFGGAPDWRCTVCRHGFAAVRTEGGLRVVDPDGLEPSDYIAMIDLLSERLRLTRAACEAVVDSPDPADGTLATLDELRAWIGNRYPLVRRDLGFDAGLDRIVVPRDLRPVADLLDAAAEVCRAAEALWSAPEGSRFEEEQILDDAIDAYTDVRDEHDDDFFELLDRAKVSAEAVDPDDGWDEVRDIAARVFDVWVGGSERAWARYAWGVLHRAGLTAFGTHVERARSAVRLLALSVLYREFCARAFDEGRPGDWTIVDPRIDPFVLGILAERDGVDADIEVDYDAEDQRAFAVRELVVGEYATVVATLRQELGQVVLFATLWASSEESVHYPLPATVVGGVGNADVWDTMRAWEWMDSGMELS